MVQAFGQHITAGVETGPYVRHAASPKHGTRFYYNSRMISFNAPQSGIEISAADKMLDLDPPGLNTFVSFLEGTPEQPIRRHRVEIKGGAVLRWDVILP